MKLVKIALKNMMLHKISSLVLIIVFSVATFTLFWAYGYSNSIISLVQDINRVSYGDVAFLTEYFKKEKLSEISKIPGVKKVVFEREINVMIDGDQKSSLVTMLEITDENRERLSKFIRPVIGSLPEKENEIVITDFVQKGMFAAGDQIYATTSTPEKVLNTIQYKVSGVAKSSAFKAIGYGFMISEKGMNSLVNSKTDANLIYLFLEDQFTTPAAIDSIYKQVKELLEKKSVTIKTGWTITERQQQLSIFSLTFLIMKIFMLIIIFPLLGAVIGAIVWIYSFKRRREIWTYISLGMKDRDLLVTFAAEYWFIACAGIFLGILGGEISAFIADSANIWLVFSYTFSSPLRAAFDFLDFLIITGFMFFSVMLWIIFPLKKIMKAVPFSY